MMQTSNKPQSRSAIGSNKGVRPENKDNLDSRKGEEQETKGDDVTHNKKETKGEPKKKNK